MIPRLISLLSIKLTEQDQASLSLKLCIARYAVSATNGKVPQIEYDMFNHQRQKFDLNSLSVIMIAFI
jgi:hypothetical protein